MGRAAKPKWTESDHETWRQLYANLEKSRKKQAFPRFQEGLDVLGITGDEIPDLDDVNAKLKKLTGWQGVFEEGFVEPKDFFKGLTRKEFPVGNFIRDKGDLSYTPAPDVFHDLYGHLPLFIDQGYADYCERFGHVAGKFAGDPEKLVQFDRLFWFSIEFPLIMVDGEKRIFGGGILSSAGECDYSLSDEPEVRPFDLNVIRKNDFKIDEYQKILYLLETEEQLYSCLPKFEELVAAN